MHRPARIARWLILAFCLLGLMGCATISDRSLNLLYPPETPPPPEPGSGVVLEMPSATPVLETTPVATLTWPVPQPSDTPSLVPPTTSVEPQNTEIPPSPEPTQEMATQPVESATQPAGATPTVESTESLPSATPVPEPTAVTTATLQTAAQTGLVFLEKGALYRGDRWGASPEQIAEFPTTESLAFRHGMLATAQGPSIEVVDLASGKRISAKLDVAEPDYVELMWGSGDQCLVYGALAAQGGAKAGKRYVELRVLDVSAAQTTGELATIGRIVLDDVESVSLLRYNEDQKRLLLVPRGQHPVFMEIRFYDVASGQLVDTYPAEGQGDVLISPDGRYVLTEQFTDSGAQFALYDLQAQGETRPQVWPHEKGAYSMFPVWSPDGRQIAYLLRRNREGKDDSVEALGLWVLDVASGQARRILEEDSELSSLVGWTPEGEYVVGHYEADEASYYYALRPDGGDRRILLLQTQAHILGWMPVTTPGLSN